jgi:hypothetical protein
MAWTQEKINEIYVKVQQLATTDEEFRAELLKDSSAAIAKVAGEELPADFKVKVVENDPQYAATFVLPPMAGEELADDELDSVAGGFCLIDGTCGARACAAQSDNELCAANASGK